MVERFSCLRCKEVINVSDGSRLGFVSDLELELDTGRVLTLIVPCPGRFFGLFGSKEVYVVPWPCIRRIGGDIILVDVKPDECRRGKGKKAGWKEK